MAGGLAIDLERLSLIARSIAINHCVNRSASDWKRRRDNAQKKSNAGNVVVVVGVGVGVRREKLEREREIQSKSTRSQERSVVETSTATVKRIE